MKAVFLRAVALAASVSLAGCATGPNPAQVTRFHLNQPIARGPIAIEPFDPKEAGSIEFNTYADAVARQLTRLGWTIAPAGESEQVAMVRFEQGNREEVGNRSPVSIGLGGSTGGWGSGVGGGISFGLGGKRSNIVTASLLSVRIQRRSDSTVFWEGRAQSEASGRSPESSPAGAADRLAAALFQDFPGESGRTISVK